MRIDHDAITERLVERNPQTHELVSLAGRSAWPGNDNHTDPDQVIGRAHMSHGRRRHGLRGW